VSDTLSLGKRFFISRVAPVWNGIDPFYNPFHERTFIHRLRVVIRADAGHVGSLFAAFKAPAIKHTIEELSSPPERQVPTPHLSADGTAGNPSAALEIALLPPLVNLKHPRFKNAVPAPDR